MTDVIDRHHADDNERLRRENLALRQDIEAHRAALQAKSEACEALRRQLADVQALCTERVEAAARQIARIRETITGVILK